MPTADQNDGGTNKSVVRRGLRMVAQFIRELFRPSGLPRKLVLGFSWLILAIIGSVSGKWAYDDWNQTRPKIGVSDKFTIATLAITFFAAVVALLAYQVSTGAPDLQLGIMFYKHKDPYNYRLEYSTARERWAELKRWFDSQDPPHGEQEPVRDPDWPKHIAYIWVNNRSRYPAKSPVIIARFGENDDKSSLGLCRSRPQEENPDEPWRDKEEGLTWKDIAFKSSGIVVLATQWDGGSAHPIHGKSTRRLPNLPLTTLFSSEQTNQFRIELLAEGYRKVVKVTIEFKVIENAPQAHRRRLTGHLRRHSHRL